MLNRTILCVLTLVALLAFPVLSFAEYKVVMKKNGKIIEGKLVGEDGSSVSIISAGTRLRFLKKDLDLDRMKEVNAGYQTDSDVKDLDVPSSSQSTTSSDATTLADLAKQNRDAAQGGGQKSSTTSSDTNERALVDWVAELERTNKVIPAEDTEIQLSKAKKGLAHYRARASERLSDNDRKIMLEQLINALDFMYRKALEREAPDDELKALKKQIKEREQELKELTGE
ncbi:hypothetical protein L0222_25590 [bacterium]|nr:hypothetical protein [bacterium]MCI0606918.1 hypothetical protein [bacterium]